MLRASAVLLAQPGIELLGHLVAAAKGDTKRVADAQRVTLSRLADGTVGALQPAASTSRQATTARAIRRISAFLLHPGIAQGHRAVEHGT